MTSFKKGDLVLVVDMAHSYYGYSGRVMEVRENSVEAILFKYPEGTAGRWILSKSQIKIQEGQPL